MFVTRLTRIAIAVLAVVDILYTLVAIATYEHRITVVTHDGSGVPDALGTVVPLDELSRTMPGVLLITLFATVAAGTVWVTRTRRAGARVVPAALVRRLRTVALVAVPLNLIAAAQYLFATGNGAEYMRAVRAATLLLLIGAAVALLATTMVGRTIVRHTAAGQRHTAGDPATTG